MKKLLPPLLAQLQLDRLVPRLFTGWCLAAMLETCVSATAFTSKLFSGEVTVWRFALVMVLFTVVTTAISINFNIQKWETSVLLVAAFGYLAYLAYYEHDFWFSMGLVFVMLCVCLYALQKDNLPPDAFNISERTAKIIIFIGVSIFTLYSAGVTVGRYVGYSSSTYDLGIFAQMFHYMKETGLPITTCERDQTISHFAVHLSPIWYLLLPGYMIFSTPVYLQIMQSVVLALGVIPLYLLTKHMGFSPRVRTLVCLTYCFFPALTGGQFYDIHENIFLTPLLLALFYCYETDRKHFMWCFAILTLLVKEDAAIYVAAFALYVICGRKDYKTGLPLLLAAIVYFFVATALLAALGDGVMTDTRFGPYLPEGSNSMLDVLKTVFFNPAYLFKEVFKAEKVQFLLLMLVPVAFTPFCTKKVSGLLLLIPTLLVNVMPDWVYQYSIHFQYVFGSIAMIFYLSVINIKELSSAVRRVLLPSAVCFALILSLAHVSLYADNITAMFKNADSNRTIAVALDKIPEDASVVSHGYMLPAVANRRVVYDLSTRKSAEYIVIDMRPGRESDAAELDTLYASTPERFERIEWHGNLVAVYRDRYYVQNNP